MKPLNEYEAIEFFHRVKGKKIKRNDFYTAKYFIARDFQEVDNEYFLVGDLYKESGAVESNVMRGVGFGFLFDTSIYWEWYEKPENKCTCGAAKVNSPFHSDWCDYESKK